MNTDPRIRTLAEARQQVGIDTGRTFAWDDLNPIEQGNALAVAAAWLEAAVAAGIAPPAAVPVPPPADQTALRDRIRRAICEAEGFAWDTDMLEPDEYGDVADAVLAVLPEQTDRAALLRAADIAEDVAESLRKRHEFERSTGALDVMTELRRVAAEEQPATPDTDASRRIAAVERLCGGRPGYHTITVKALLTAMSEAAEEQPAETPMFGSPDCTCIPFTRQGGKPRYCGPTDTVDMISGWEIGRDCPHHKPAVGEQPETQETRCPAKHGALGRICELPPHHSGMHTGSGPNGGAVWQGDAP